MRAQIHNPFDMESTYPIPYRYIVRWFDQLIENAPAGETITCGVYGLFGAGKSRLLSRYFSDEKCRELAERGQLYPMIMTSKNPDPEAWFEGICNELLAYVKKYVPAEKQPVFPTKEESQDGDVSDRLEKMVRLLRENGYGVSLVLDEFHHISRSETVCNDHYEIFRVLDKANATKMHFVVATDCDFDPGNGSHTQNFTTSFFIHSFKSQFATVTGMEREEFDDFIESFTPAGEEAFFTAAEKELLFHLSGGLPAVARQTASVLLRCKRSGITSETEITDRALAAVQGQFDIWCESMTKEQKALLKKTIGAGISDYYHGWENHAFDILKKRGFIVEVEDETHYGGFGTLRYCCALFRIYIEEHFTAEYNEKYGAVVREINAEQESAFIDAETLRRDIEEELERRRENGTLSGIAERRMQDYLTELKEIMEKLSMSACDRRTVLALDKKRDKIQLKFGRLTGWQE